MNMRRWFAVALGVTLAGATVAAAQTAGSLPAAGDTEGLVRIASKRFDQIEVRPGTDFRGYTKVMLDPAQVTFAKNWRRDLNAQRITLLARTTTEDAERIAAAASKGLDEEFGRAFKRAGYEIVTAPGPDVLVVSPRVADLYINAPETITMAVPSRVYTQEAGEATLALDVRDATTGALLARFEDHRTAGDRGNFRSSFMLTTPVSNRFDFGRLADFWARGSVRSLGEFKAQSPVAAPALAH